MPALDTLRAQIAEYPMLEAAIGLTLLVLAAVLVDWLVRHVLLRIGHRVLKTVGLDDEAEPMAPRPDSSSRGDRSIRVAMTKMAAIA